MLARLRHDAVVGRHDQQDEIDAARPGQHVVDELLVAGHVDEAEHRAIRRRQIGEAEVDGDAARLFFLEAIGVDSGERVHQRSLAVIDVACSADDHGVGSGRGVAARRSASAISSADKAPRAVLRNGSASALPPARARSSHANAATPSRGTPAPSTCAAPSIAWPSASPRAAALAHHIAAATGSRSTSERVVINHANARHRRRDALRSRGECPASCLDGIERNAFAFEQHPAQHVLRRRVAGFGRRAVEIGGAGVILFDTLALEIERGQVSSADRVARFRRQFQPAQRQFLIALDTEPLGEAGADIVLRPRNAGLRQRPPDCERRRIVAAPGRFIGLGHEGGDILLALRATAYRQTIRPPHNRLRDQGRQDSPQTPPLPQGSADRGSARHPRRVR